MKPTYWDDAKRALSKRDAVLRRIIRAHPEVHLRRRTDPFTALSRAIVGQQISVKAADTIWNRFVLRAGSAGRRGAFPRLDAPRVLELDDVSMREVGLSRSKAGYVRDLAQHFVSGKLDPRKWRKLEDDALVALLIDVNGIGRWTAEMFMIFHELRPDVFPVGDVGLRRALASHYNQGEAMTVDDMHALGAAWRPYRSVATWYLWRSLDPLPVEY
jgi:DNA-3-methyladenine glycosylase II